MDEMDRTGAPRNESLHADRAVRHARDKDARDKDKDEDRERSWLCRECKAILNLLKSPCFGLEEIKEEVMGIEDKLDSPLFGLCELKQEVKAIERKLDQVVPVSGTLTTGAVVADNPASSLVVKVLNNSASTVTVTVNVYHIGTCPNPKTLASTTSLTIQSKCALAFIFPKPPLEYEVEFVGIVPGVYAWTATRNQAQAAPLSSSNFIASNTFRHSELVPQIDP